MRRLLGACLQAPLQFLFTGLQFSVVVFCLLAVLAVPWALLGFPGDSGALIPLSLLGGALGGGYAAGRRLFLAFFRPAVLEAEEAEVVRWSEERRRSRAYDPYDNAVDDGGDGE